MNIRELRLSTGLSQQKFADYFKIPFRTLQNWEYGEREAPEYLLELIEYKLIKEGLMTSEYLKKNATKIDEVDMRDGGIYLGTTTYYLYNNHLYADEYHSNLNRYTGDDKVYVIIDDVKKDMNKYNEQYFIFDIGLSKEGYERLVEYAGK